MRRITQKFPIYLALLACIATSATAFAREPVYFSRMTADSAPGVPERTLNAAGYDLITGDARVGDAFLINYLGTAASGNNDDRVVAFNSVAMIGYACFVGGQPVILAGSTYSSMRGNTQTSVTLGKKLEAGAAQQATEDAIKWLNSPAAKGVKDDCAFLHAHFKS